MSKENILLDLKAVRILRLDANSVEVQILKTMPAGTYRKPGTKEQIEKPERKEWQFFGYYGNVKSAIRAIYHADLLMDDKERSLEEYIEEDKRNAERLKGFM